MAWLWLGGQAWLAGMVAGLAALAGLDALAWNHQPIPYGLPTDFLTVSLRICGRLHARGQIPTD